MKRMQPRSEAVGTADDGVGKANPVDEPLKSVFSTVRTVKVGTGTTARKQETRLLWYVEQKNDAEYAVRKINPQFVPVGDETIIGKEELLNDYTPEVEIHNSQVKPAIVNLAKTISRGDRHREEGQYLSAEMEYTNALEVDEQNVRATFGLGLVYLQRKDVEKSQMVFQELVGMQAAFSSKHKHLFNEFGISLRKSDLYDEAIQYYKRAVELTETDENLYANLARVYFEQGDWAECMNSIDQALTIDGEHDYVLSLCHYIKVLASDDAKRQKLDKPPVPGWVAEHAAEVLGDWSPTRRSRKSKSDRPDTMEIDLTGI